MIKSVLFKCHNINCGNEWEEDVINGNVGNLDQTCPKCLGIGTMYEWTTNLDPEPTTIKEKESGLIKFKAWIKNNVEYFFLYFTSVIVSLVILVPSRIKGDLSDIKYIPIFYLLMFLLGNMK